MNIRTSRPKSLILLIPEMVSTISAAGEDEGAIRNPTMCGAPTIQVSFNTNIF